MTNRPEQIAPTAGVRIDLIRALAKLPPNQRRAVVLRHLDSSKTTEQEVY
jgi:DNA-directed RNA polymerase specialized sigma24 family protein